MLKILVVDDDVEFGKAFSNILRVEGYEAQAALSAAEALGFLRESGFSIVFADLSLPGESGLILLEKIKKDYPGLPVVIITAFGDWDTYAASIEKGSSSFISKPIKKDEILKVIKDILG